MDYLLKMKVLVLVGVVTLLFCSPALAGLSGNVAVSYFNPAYGEINDDIEWLNVAFGTDLKFESGLAWGFGLNYSIGPNWVVRGEYFGFSPETADSYSVVYEYEGVPYAKDEGDINLKASLNAWILSGIYRFLPDRSFSPYVGIGVGSFLSKLRGQGSGKYYSYDEVTEEWVLEESYSGAYSDEVTPVGFQVLGGGKYKIGESFFLAGELRYVSAKAEDLVVGEAGEPTDIDWSGFSIGLEAGYRF